MRKILFGFHNGEKYGSIEKKINDVVKNAGYDGIKMKDEYPDIEIPVTVNDVMTAQIEK